MNSAIYSYIGLSLIVYSSYKLWGWNSVVMSFGIYFMIVAILTYLRNDK